MEHYAKIEYLAFRGATFFTVVLLPEKGGSYPTVIFRSPYVQNLADLPAGEVVETYLKTYGAWLTRGYAVLIQHCRGRGKSTGDFVPYIYEREDGLELSRWVREQEFYNGELFLCGGSYTASLHYATAPFEADIKAAVFEVQDSERYRLWYRNGQMRKGHANWHFGLYKTNLNRDKRFSMGSFSQLPLKDLSERVLNDRAEDFEQMLFAQFPENDFWKTRYGGIEAKNAANATNIPILFTTGYNDFYVGGMFKMWAQMSAATRRNCAMLVSPYDHGDGYKENDGISFPGGKRAEQFGSTYRIDWCDHIRKGSPLPYPKGEITYYRTFENRWEGAFYRRQTKPLTIPLGAETATFRYDPLDPPTFRAEGTFLPNFAERTDVVSLCLPPMERDVFVKGRMEARLAVSSDRADTAFYMMVSIQKPQGDYVLRHDITSLCYQLGDYTPNREVDLHFCFDEHAFLLKKGETLRLDIASTDNGTYVCHTNQKGPYALQASAAIATNKVDLSRSVLILPIEDDRLS